MNNVLLITGSSTGFGREIALKFAREKWTTIATVKLLDENSTSLEKIALMEKLDLHVFKMDVTLQRDIDETITKVIHNFKKIDVLINNAGFGFIGPVEDFTIEEIIEQYNVNLFGAIRLNKAVVPKMRENRSGKIINISSVNGLVSFPLYGIYSSSKFALETISEVQRFELAPFGIKVILIEPGAFSTNYSTNRKIPEQLQAGNSIYKKWASAFLENIMKYSQKKKGVLGETMNPIRVALLCWKIANIRNPKLRYKIGIDTHFYTFARSILPYSIWKYCINLVFKWR